jgi:hypothetical protein
MHSPTLKPLNAEPRRGRVAFAICGSVLAFGASAWAQAAREPPPAGGVDPRAGADSGAPDATADGGVSEDAGNVPDAEAPADGSASSVDSRAQEEAEIAAELARMHGPAAEAKDPGNAPRTTAGGSESTGSSASSRGLSNLMNPAISAVGLVLAGASSRPEGATGGVPDDLETGIFVQEVELRASAIVDPYFRADVAIAGNADEIGFEEAYITTLEIPRVTFRAGQMHATVGRHNLLHTHAFPFLTAPLPWRALLGPEGLADPGVSADVLLPLPFYTEITAQVFQGEWGLFEGSIPDDPATTLIDESVPDRRHNADFGYVGHLKTLFDLSDSTTLEPGVSYVGGRNGFGGLTSLVAGDLTFRWKPIEAERYLGFDWTTEYAWIERENAPTDRRLGGGFTAVRFQFAQRWWLQARGAVLGLPAGDAGRIVRGEALGAFVPSEFSALRLQYAIEKAENDPARPVHEVFAQAVFSIGPHPAHAY